AAFLRCSAEADVFAHQFEVAATSDDAVVSGDASCSDTADAPGSRTLPGRDPGTSSQSSPFLLQPAAAGCGVEYPAAPPPDCDPPAPGESGGGGIVQTAGQGGPPPPQSPAIPQTTLMPDGSVR